MKNTKKILAILLTLTMTFTSMTAFALPEYGEEYQKQQTTKYNQKFTDVPKSNWAFPYIMEMNQRGVLSGYPNGNFYPNNTITRAEFAKIMCIASGMNISPVTTTSYIDVKPDDWFAPYIESGKYYLSGYISDNQKYYLPNDNALREDIAVALVKLKGYDTSLYDESILKAMFKDWQSISIGARKYVSVAVENGLISGYEDDTFRGQNTVTRAEAATLLWRAYQYGNGNKVFEKEEIDIPNTESSNKNEYESNKEKEDEEFIEEEFIEVVSLKLDKKNITIEEGEKITISATVEDNNRYNEFPETNSDNFNVSAKISIIDDTHYNFTIVSDILDVGDYDIEVTYKNCSEKVKIVVKKAEPDYLYELKTISSNVTNVDEMLSTNDGIIYINNDQVIEVKKNSNKGKVLVDDTLGYIGNEEISKAELSNYRISINCIGYDYYNNEKYCIVEYYGMIGGNYLYNIDTGESKDITIITDYIREKYSYAGNPYYTTPNSYASRFIIDKNNNIVTPLLNIDVENNKVSKILYENGNSLQGLITTINNKKYIVGSDPYGNYIAILNNRTGYLEEIDFYIPSDNIEIIGANNKLVYFTTNDGVFSVNTDGDSKLLFNQDDINNIDEKIIDLSIIKTDTATVDNDGTIYYWDINYNCIRQLNKV